MCTDFRLVVGDGSFVGGRSMEFGRDLHTQIFVPDNARAIPLAV